MEDTGEVFELRGDITTVGRGDGVDVHLDEPSVSRLHAELVRRGPHVYVTDLGLSSNGTRVNGRPIGRRVLTDGDVLSFGAARVRVGGLSASQQSADDTVELRRVTAPDLTRREGGRRRAGGDRSGREATPAASVCQVPYPGGR
jgi:pSer/pThr/pTyr-binding forkhead associated (FHA) protein